MTTAISPQSNQTAAHALFHSVGRYRFSFAEALTGF